MQDAKNICSIATHKMVRLPALQLIEAFATMAEGRSNQAIADRLFVTLRAVEKHVTSIFAKLNLPATTDDHRRVLAVLAFLQA